MSLVNKMLSFVRSSHATFVALLGLASLAGGCASGDSATGVGDFGRLQYSLHSDYFMTSDEIRDVRIVTGHQQHISVYWADPEEADSEDDETVWRHRLAGSTDTPSDSSDMDASIRSDVPGTYLLESFRDGDLLDQIELTFEKPASLEIVVYVRQPYASDFEKVATGYPSLVSEGAQVAFVVVPLGADGERLAGNIGTDHHFSPDWAAVPGANVFSVYEDGVNQGVNMLTYYLIESGEVTIDFEDTVYGIRGSHTFEVAPANPAE